MKFICIGKNYLAHAREMGWQIPQEPMFFFKPENALPSQAGIFPYPEFSQDVHYEIEVAVRIDAGGRNLTEEQAAGCYSHISLGIDFTARDLQKQQKELGFPWEICKSFEDSAPVGSWIPLEEFGGDIQNLSFTLEVNGEGKQQGATRDMIFPVNQLIAHISRYVTLDPGDIMFTGTPEGIGPVQPGDTLKGYLEGTEVITVTVQ